MVSNEFIIQVYLYYYWVMINWFDGICESKESSKSSTNCLESLSLVSNLILNSTVTDSLAKVVGTGAGADNPNKESNASAVTTAGAAEANLYLIL